VNQISPKRMLAVWIGLMKDSGSPPKMRDAPPWMT